MPKFEWRGTDKLQKKLQSMLELNMVKKIVKVNGDELNRRMSEKALFTKGYSTGQTKRSINTAISDDGLAATVGATTEYASYPEYGTRFMDAQPFVRPSHNVQKEIFKKDMDRLV